MSNEFRFDKADHSYWLGKTRLIGVSDAIQAAGLKDFSRIAPDVLEHARQRGTAVHAACHYLDEGDLNWETVSPEVEPYVRAWERFKRDVPSVMMEKEIPLYHATLGFAGTPDRIMEMSGDGGRRITIDLKTYRPDAVTGVQLAAYSLLRWGPQPSWDVPKRWGLWLKDDGKYQLTDFTDRGDEAVFLACLTIAKFKRSQK